jgi:hypothetical protein
MLLRSLEATERQLWVPKSTGREAEPFDAEFLQGPEFPGVMTFNPGPVDKVLQKRYITM